MESLLKKRFTTEQTEKSPIFYFETEIELNVYQANKGYTISSNIEKESIDLEAFKMEFLTDATELIELPKEISLVIKQE